MPNYKVKVVKTCDESLTDIKTKVGDYLGIFKLQTFFPILSNYFDFYNGSNKEFTLKTRYHIKNIVDKVDYKVDDSYIKHFLNCNIRDIKSGKEAESKIFVKELPLLNVVHYLTNDYKLENTCLPNSYHADTLKKINNPNNSAYIDVFFSHLGSTLTENGKCPTFPLFYGSFTGIKDDFKTDISEDYEDLCENDDFMHGLGSKYTIEDFELEKDPFINHELLNSECIINADDIDTILDDTILDDTILDDTITPDSDELILESDELIPDSDELILESDELIPDSDELILESDELIPDSDELILDNDITTQELEAPDSVLEAPDSVLEAPDLYSNSDSEAPDLYSNSDSEAPDLYSDSDSNSDSDSDNGHITKLDLSDVRVLASDCSMSDISASSNDSDALKYVHIPNFPVQLNMIETMDMTLDNYIDNSIDKRIPPTEWKSILFQITFGLAVAQKHFLFVHNDLHSSNIMFKKTEKEFIYFKFRDNFFKIPTFNKISKIIDFGRATFKLGNQIYFSDVFKKNEDAFGQYTYPYNNSLKNCRLKPNMSFDLSRLATTIMERFDDADSKYDEVKRLLTLWVTDRHGNNLSELEEDFDLYKLIAKNVKSAHPKSQLNKKLWSEFMVEESDIPKSEFIYKY
jgi:hypothetical protein